MDNNMFLNQQQVRFMFDGLYLTHNSSVPVTVISYVL